MTLQQALADYLAKKPIPSKKEEQAGKTHQTHQAAETLTTQQRVAQAIVDARHK
jgi:hypothetical protein